MEEAKARQVQEIGPCSDSPLRVARRPSFAVLLWLRALCIRKGSGFSLPRVLTAGSSPTPFTGKELLLRCLLRRTLPHRDRLPKLAAPALCRARGLHHAGSG